MNINYCFDHIHTKPQKHFSKPEISFNKCGENNTLYIQDFGWKQEKFTKYGISPNTRKITTSGFHCKYQHFR
jgi:hypothetical protein